MNRHVLALFALVLVATVPTVNATTKAACPGTYNGTLTGCVALGATFNTHPGATVTYQILNISLPPGVQTTLSDSLPSAVTFSSLIPDSGIYRTGCTTPTVGMTGTVECTWFNTTPATVNANLAFEVVVKAGVSGLVINNIPGTYASFVVLPNGDANGDGIVTTVDLFCLINYVFASGPAPTGNGDANGDGKVDAADVVYLVNQLYG